MKKPLFIVFLFIISGCLFGCHNHALNKLKRQMKPLAEEYLKDEGVARYDSLHISRVDTITELGYAKLMCELLENMEQSYQTQYDESVRQENGRDVEILGLYLREISRTKIDFFDLINNGELKSNGLLLFMITGIYHANGQTDTVLFFVSPDSMKLHTLDPFGNNLLYRDDQSS